MTRDERGAVVTVWVALLMTVLVAVIGISVDLTGQVNAQQRAHDLAQQAGRAAANQSRVALAMQGHTPEIDPAAAQVAAADYLAAAGVTGTVTITGPTTLTIHVTTSYQPHFLAGFGVGAKAVTGDAAVDLTRVVNGAPR
ncbi:TadE/TadG family type IV pilus assembly protein [Propioniciclava tarda]|uniref:Pilus assembly protein n=1 Tax=Propioniciclava tarda TaxID=433330 RepID=A0A4Q9KKV7_PROTD|nr:pilus assembly protein TadG-related protein [Propioniciclava tarda]TBT95103.1 pilus assembly protein [Propioniciclava tarda]SMO56125.1 Putative Flp pilus-assembly TadE/G-like [Propioniciclava tarda]